MSFRVVLTSLLFSIALLSCSAQPEPINYGSDLCYHCKMTLMDEKFGSELVTKKGKVFKFDDVNCLLRYMRSGAIAKKEYKDIVVINFAKKGEMLPVSTASFLVADYVLSPMGSRVAAFSTKEAAIQFKGTREGAIYTWTELEKIVP